MPELLLTLLSDILHYAYAGCALPWSSPQQLQQACHCQRLWRQFHLAEAHRRSAYYKTQCRGGL